MDHLVPEFSLVPCQDIKIVREGRQRRVISTDSLKPSIEKRGVLNPIIVTRQLELIAGERRLQSCLELGLATIPVRWWEDLDPIELMIVEFEENLHREDLPWQDIVRTMGKLHALYLELDPEWTNEKTAQSIGKSAGYVGECLRVFRDIDSPKVLGAAGIRAAKNILMRVDQRRIGDVMSDIIHAGRSVVHAIIPKPSTPASSPSIDPQPATSNPAPILPPSPPIESILNADFAEWAASYTGQPFSFIHCDFPYGIDAFGGELSGRDKWATYNDEKATYIKLIQALCGNLDRLMAHSAHLMFWFSMQHYELTLKTFKELAPSLEFQVFPLVWVKSDNVGILPDPKRGPRRIYETALIASREDRLILKAVSNAYSAPTDKDHHPSTKPEPVLRHFMQMFIDENTRMLDPTCGSGSALRAAESLGAKHVLGLELDPEHCANAKAALKYFRTMRKAST